MKYLALFACLTVLTACGLAKTTEALPTEADGSVEPSASGAMEAFQNSFYSFARTNCAQCHGASQAPAFAVSDVGAAYSAANNPLYVDFSDPAASAFVTYAGNGHCGLPACTGNGSLALAQIQVWAAAAAAEPSPFPSALVSPVSGLPPITPSPSPTSTGQTLTPTYAGTIAPILAANCTSCHKPSNKKGGIDLSSYLSVTASPLMPTPVPTGSPTTTELYESLVGSGNQSKMPPGGGLTQAQLSAFSEWIQAGAPP